MSQRKKWSSRKKLEISLLSIKGNMTINEICKHYHVCPSQIHAWKKLLIEGGSQLFEKQDSASSNKAAALNEERQRQ